MFTIETERVFLRMPAISDLDDFILIFGSPQVMKYLEVDCQPLTAEQTEKMLVSLIGSWKKNNFGRWTVISKSDDKIIGVAGFRKHENLAELFYVLDESFWGKGLATEIARAVLRTGFEKHHFSKIVAFTRPANAASRRILDKLGMNFLGETNIYGIAAVKYEITKAAYLKTAADHQRNESL